MDLNDWNHMGDIENKPIVGAKNIETLWAYGNYKELYTDPFGIAYDISYDLVNCFEPNDLRNEIGVNYIPAFLKPYVAVEISQVKNLFSYSASGLLTNSWRSAEAYLNRAEAYIQLYKTKGDQEAANQALISLNTLRSKRFDRAAFTPWTIQPADKLLEMCRVERRRELFKEEAHRWFDLRRYGMPSIKHIYTEDGITVDIYRLQKRDPAYVLPIPNTVLTRNPALGQNALFPGKRMPE